MSRLILRGCLDPWQNDKWHQFCHFICHCAPNYPRQKGKSKVWWQNFFSSKEWQKLFEKSTTPLILSSSFNFLPNVLAPWDTNISNGKIFAIFFLRAKVLLFFFALAHGSKQPLNPYLRQYVRSYVFTLSGFLSTSLIL